ncbi:MAG: hypothetical protein IB618_01140 [Candidatus Pacearchaeota archaeon]|nr:MAG: hypothetical protein IB618_01140 [Candidatus Pacearchaeota archaeon]
MSDFDLEIRTGEGIIINLELCKGWKNIIQEYKIPDNYKKRLEDYANDLAQFSGLQKARLNWNDDWGLNFVEAYYGNACVLLLNKDEDSPSYYPHNIDTPEQTFVLMSTVLKYVWNVRASAENKLPNWMVWPIEIDNVKEAWIKINMHPKLEEIVKNSNKSEKFRKFIEECAPFSKQGYSRLTEVKFHWDDNLGLKAVEAVPGINGSALDLNKDEAGNFYYLSHNIRSPIQAVALIGSVSKYIQYLKRIGKEKCQLEN